ncbi:MAG: hypothetical protein AB8H86_06910 [Polyangiales bacterium]
MSRDESVEEKAGEKVGETTGPSSIVFRFRTLARGFRRRCSNLAWALGGSALAGLVASSMVERRYELPDILGTLLIFAGLGALLTTTVSALVSRTRKHQRWFRTIEVDGDTLKVGGPGERTLRLQDIQGVVSSGKNAWLVLHNGDVVHLLFSRDADAKRAAALFPSSLRRAPLELVPTPAGARQPMVLFLAGSFVASIAEEFLGVPFAAWFGVLSLAMLSSALWRRGSRLVVASDGIRVGSRFYSLDKLTHFTCTQSSVSWTHAGKAGLVKVRLPEGLDLALEHRVRALIAGEAPTDDALERREGEGVHAWLRRVTGLFRGGDFREPAISKERVLAAAHGKGSLRVRVAVVAALKDEAPELVEDIRLQAADPRFVRVLEAADDEEDWRKTVEALEREGQL